MATIFYWATRGVPDARPIYGVHPSGQPVQGGVPAGVASLEVAGAPHDIAWPGGNEWRSVVNTTTTPPSLIADPAAAPLPIDGVAFLRTIHLNLAGAGTAAKLARGMTLRKLSWAVRDFVHNTAHTPLSTNRQAAAKTIWGWVTTDSVIGLMGADLVNRLTQAEVDAIGADAASRGIALT